MEVRIELGKEGGGDEDGGGEGVEDVGGHGGGEGDGQ